MASRLVTSHTHTGSSCIHTSWARVSGSAEETGSWNDGTGHPRISKVVSRTTAICLTMSEKDCARRDDDVPTLRADLEEREEMGEERWGRGDGGGEMGEGRWGRGDGGGVMGEERRNRGGVIVGLDMYMYLLEDRENRDPEEEGVAGGGGREGRAQWDPTPETCTR